MVVGSDVLTYRVFRRSGGIFQNELAPQRWGRSNAVVEASDAFSSVTGDHTGSHGSSFLLQKRSAAASSCLFLPLSNRPCGNDLWQRSVAGRPPHKETVLMLGVNDPEFFDCCFQR